MPITRRGLAEEVSFALPSGEKVWRQIHEALVPRDSRNLSWVFFRSQWRTARFAALGLGRFGSSCAFVTVDPTATPRFQPAFASSMVRIPASLGEIQVGTWTGRRFEVVPRLSRTPSCSWKHIVAVAEDVSTRLASVLPRQANTPLHWCPMHGDFTPWNLREDHAGGLWLLDWEDAAWAPRVADVLRYATARRSLQHDRVPELVDAVIADVSSTKEELAEAGDFWARHHNFTLDSGEHPVLTNGKEHDLARGRREREALQAIARLAD